MESQEERFIAGGSAEERGGTVQNAPMMVNLLLGADRDRLRDTLRELGAAVSNLRSPSPGWQTRDWLTAYIEWANNAAAILRGQITPADIDRLVWTGRHQLLASKAGMLYPDMENSGLNHVLTSELDDRTTTFEAAHRALDERIRLWSTPGTFVAFDTTVYIQGDKLEEADISDLLGLTAPGGPIRLLVPMAVVDELDNLKQHNKQRVRWRAGYTTAVLYRLLHTNPTEPAPLHSNDPAVIVELLPDPPGHVRLPITDDEIIDRVANAQVLAGRKITLVTYDTGQALRAGLAGLHPLRVPNAIEQEPEPPM